VSAEPVLPLSDADLTATSRSTLRRKRERGSYERALVESILDEGLVAHVGVADADGPIVLPMVYARVGDRLYLHGAVANHLLKTAGRAQVCVTVTLLDGLVLARSAFHHSVNFRSVVLYGEAEIVEDPDEKHAAFVALVDHMVPGRSAGTRLPTPAEVRTTAVVGLTIDEGSAKVRTGPPIDDDEDLALDVWAGVIPVATRFGAPEPDEGRPRTMELPEHVRGRADLAPES
jgi:nitroimidazol reductase NimA-like FMN-containing flavoprotein (pyridoxamine 5'-phosphate oxidase superfamily)